MGYFKISGSTEKYWKDIGFKLSDENLATIIWNEVCGLEDRLDALEKLMDDRKPDENLSLQISTIFERYEGIRQSIRNHNNNEYFYRLSRLIPGSNEPWYDTFSDDYELLENLAINKKGEYRLGKIGKISDAKQFERKHGLRDYYECERCFIEYSHKGRVTDIGTCEADFRSVDEGVDFCRKYIGIPHPFKALDVVSSFRNGEKRIGLISPLYQNQVMNRRRLRKCFLMMF